MVIASTLLPRSIALPKSTKLDFIHYLRALLREITYIPDPFTRKYHHNEILRRFRRYLPKNPSELPTEKLLQQKHIKNQEDLLRCYKNCQEKLSFLYRAGNGDYEALTKAIWMAYGRVGKRKHVLLRPYLLPDVPKDAEELDRALSAPTTLTLELPKSIRAILMEQAKQPREILSSSSKNTKQFTQPVLPETNSWGRPMPTRRLLNQKKAQFLVLKAKIFPPLPEAEFLRLQDLASGEIPCPPIPTRRKRLKGLPMLPLLKSNHVITPRTMRRMWAQLLPFCSTIKYDRIRDKWNVTWGSAMVIPTASLKVGDRSMLYLQQALQASAADSVETDVTSVNG